MPLQDEILSRSREIQTDGYAMSIGEVISMYKDGDLEIHPEFQRVFRWSDDQKSRLIESVLLGIPIPSIFVSQREDGVWDVVDGVQRLSTILQFVGVYRDDRDILEEPSTLLGTEYLPSLEGTRYEVPNENGPIFDEILRRDFKRSKLDFRIVKKESDKDAKFDLFQRLNSGTELSEQEARNCLLVMIDASFYQWVVDISHLDGFNSTVSLSDRKEDEGFRQELVLRFFMHIDYTGDERQLDLDLGPYITRWMRAAAMNPSFDRSASGTVFASVFELINVNIGDNAFRRWDAQTERFLGGFSISAFEAISSGLAANLDAWVSMQDPSQALLAKIQAIWDSPDFRNNSGTGVSPRRRLPKMIHFGRHHFQP